jgi:hypothetical protein
MIIPIVLLGVVMSAAVPADSLCPAYPPDGFSDAQVVAANFYPGLLAPDSLVSRVGHDLALIRQAVPFLATAHHWPDPGPPAGTGPPGGIIVHLTAEAAARFIAGTHDGMNALHAQFGMPNIFQLSAQGFALCFMAPYRFDDLVPLYEVIDGVFDVDALPVIGDGSKIRLQEDGTYLFRYAWGDCPSGCIYQHIWVFRVTGETVELLEEYGTPLPVKVVPSTWGLLKSLFR